IRWAYASAGCSTVGLLFDGVAARDGSVALGFTVELMALSLVYQLAMRRGTAYESKGFGMRWVRNARFGFLYAMHVLLIFTAYRFAPIAYVGSLKRLSILTTVALGWWLLGEKKAGKRMFPALMITAGAVLLFFDPGSSTIVAHADDFLRALVH